MELKNWNICGSTPGKKNPLCLSDSQQKFNICSAPTYFLFFLNSLLLFKKGETQKMKHSFVHRYLSIYWYICIYIYIYIHSCPNICLFLSSHLEEWPLHQRLIPPPLTSYSLYTQVMLMLILIDVQYLKNVGFCFEKHSNGQIPSFSIFQLLVKKSTSSKISHSPN